MYPAVCPSPQSETLNFDNGGAFLLYDRRGEMPEPFELIGIEKGIHCGTRTGGYDNLDVNLFKPDAVDRTYFYFRTPTAERLVLTQTALLWMAMAIHGIPFYHILKTFFDLA